MKLKNFVMVMFGKDTMVDPKESEVWATSMKIGILRGMKWSVLKPTG